MPGTAGSATLAHSPVSVDTASAWSMTRAGFSSSRIWALSSAVSWGLSRAAVTPRLRAPSRATTKATPLGSARATRSPAPTPLLARARANPRARASSSAKVSVPVSQTSAGRAGSCRAVASIREAKLKAEVLQAEPLPYLGRDAVPWRVGGEGGLGGGVHAPLRREPVLAARGGVEVGAAGVSHDGDVTVGLAARGQGPRHLAVVEDVHVVIDHHHALHVEIGAEDGQDRVLGLPGESLLDGDVAGERRG